MFFAAPEVRGAYSSRGPVGSSAGALRVAAVAVAAVLAGDAVVAGAGAGQASTDVLVATISACHGAASLLHLGSPGSG